MPEHVDKISKWKIYVNEIYVHSWKDKEEFCVNYDVQPTA